MSKTFTLKGSRYLDAYKRLKYVSFVSLKGYLILIFSMMGCNVYKLYINNASNKQLATSIYVFTSVLLTPSRLDFISVNEIKQSGKPMLRDNDCSLLLSTC